MTIILSKKCFRMANLIQKNLQLWSVRNFSLTSAFNCKAFITKEKDPAKHSFNDTGLFYTLPNSLSLNILFKYNTFAEDYINECITFDETPILIRKPALEIINHLKNSNYNAPINKYFIYGKYGSGKTLILAHVIHYAYLSNWLIVHVPRIKNWIYTRHEAVPSLNEDGCMDIPILATAWLNHFKSQNEELIKKIDLKIERDYKWNIREENKKGESLLSLINHGIARAKYASNVINAVLEEVKLASTSGKVKTLVAIGDYPLIFQSNTKIKNPEFKYVTPERISCISTFKNLVKADWHNAAAVLTCNTVINSNNVDDHLPMKQLGTKGFEFLDPFIPIEVPMLTENEIMSILTYYRSKKWLLRSDGDQEFKFLCGGNPLSLRRLCGPA